MNDSGSSCVVLQQFEHQHVRLGLAFENGEVHNTGRVRGGVVTASYLIVGFSEMREGSVAKGKLFAWDSDN